MDTILVQKAIALFLMIYSVVLISGRIYWNQHVGAFHISIFAGAGVWFWILSQ
jgi:hypothetical protein